MSDLINWSEKILEMDAKIKKEMEIDDESKIDKILVSIQVAGSEPLEPAIIKSEDDIFLDVYVLGGMSTNQLKPTAVLKKEVQSVGIIGGVEIETDSELSLAAMNPNEDSNPKGLYF